MGKNTLKLALGLLFLCRVGHAVTATPTSTPSTIPTPLPCPRNVWLYYPYWGTYNASNIPYNKVTHLAHSFIGPNADGSLDVPAGFIEPALITNSNAAGVKVIISVGGASATYDANFRTIAASAALRTTFIDNLEAFMRTNGYTGVDVDWEFPASATDRTNLNLLIQEIRAKFNASAAPSPTWIISAAISWGSWSGQWWDINTLKNYMDYFNIMVYDMYGNWSNMAGPNAARDDPAAAPASVGTYNGVWSMNYWINTRGAPASKVQYGLPFYGYQYPGVENHFGACSSCPFTYRPYSYILGLVGVGWTRTFEALSDSPYLRNDAGTGYISYDDAQSIAAKASWALWTRGVGGVFAWEITQDYLGPGNQPLLDALWNAAQCPPPSATPTISVTASISPTITETRTWSPTRTASPSISPSPSATEIPPSNTVTETFTPSPTVTLSSSPSDTVTATPSVLMSSTPSETETMTASSTLSPSESPTLSPVIAGFQNTVSKVIQILAFPNPVHGAAQQFSVALNLDGAADRLELRLYSSAMTLVATQRIDEPFVRGWNKATFLMSQGLASGLYFFVVQASLGTGQPVSSKTSKAYVAH